MIETLDLSEPLQAIEHRLKGHEYVNGQWVRVRTPLIPDDSRAFAKVLAILHAYIGKQYIMSNLTKPFIEVSLCNLFTDLYIDFHKNFEQYKFHTKEDVDIIIDIVLDVVMATQLRALGGKEAKMYYQGQSISISAEDKRREVRM